MWFTFLRRNDNDIRINRYRLQANNIFAFSAYRIRIRIESIEWDDKILFAFGWSHSIRLLWADRSNHVMHWNIHDQPALISNAKTQCHSKKTQTTHIRKEEKSVRTILKKNPFICGFFLAIFGVFSLFSYSFCFDGEAFVFVSLERCLHHDSRIYQIRNIATIFLSTYVILYPQYSFELLKWLIEMSDLFQINSNRNNLPFKCYFGNFGKWKYWIGQVVFQITYPRHHGIARGMLKPGNRSPGPNNPNNGFAANGPNEWSKTSPAALESLVAGFSFESMLMLLPLIVPDIVSISFHQWRDKCRKMKNLDVKRRQATHFRHIRTTLFINLPNDSGLALPASSLLSGFSASRLIADLKWKLCCLNRPPKKSSSVIPLELKDKHLYLV